MASVRVRRLPFGQRIQGTRSPSRHITLQVIPRVAHMGRMLRKKTATPVTIRLR